jgi:hypothetical protein
MLVSRLLAALCMSLRFTNWEESGVAVRDPWRRLLGVVLCVGAAFVATGCATLGRVLLVDEDNARPSRSLAALAQQGDLHPGDLIHVTTWTGGAIDGLFGGVTGTAETADTMIVKSSGRDLRLQESAIRAVRKRSSLAGSVGSRTVTFAAWGAILGTVAWFWRPHDPPCSKEDLNCLQAEEDVVVLRDIPPLIAASAMTGAAVGLFWRPMKLVFAGQAPRVVLRPYLTPHRAEIRVAYSLERVLP